MIQWLLNSAVLSVAGWILALGWLAVAAGVLSTRPRETQSQWVQSVHFWIPALFGPLIVLMWHVFNAIENALGLDSVAALVINLLLFCAIGLLIGYLIRRSLDSSRIQRGKAHGHIEPELTEDENR